MRAALALLLSLAATSAGAQSNEDIRECLSVDRARDAVRACFIEQGRPLVTASQERPESIATSVDALCQAPKAALVRQLMRCMRVDQARDVVEKLASSLRGAVIAAVVQERAGAPLKR